MGIAQLLRGALVPVRGGWPALCLSQLRRAVHASHLVPLALVTLGCSYPSHSALLFPGLTTTPAAYPAPPTLRSPVRVRSTELFSYTRCVTYAVLTSLVALERVDLKAKVVDSPEILSVIGQVRPWPLGALGKSGMGVLVARSAEGPP